MDSYQRVQGLSPCALTIELTEIANETRKEVTRKIRRLLSADP
jgi:hypothetical protein